MNIWYLLSVPSFLIILLTVGARLVDLGPDQLEFQHHIRRIALAALGAVFFTFLFAPLAKDSWAYAQQTWRLTVISNALAVIWVTADNLPPWDVYMSGLHRQTDEWKGKNFWQRLGMNWKALRSGFVPRRKRPPQ